MNTTRSILIILICAVITFIERWLPFAIFGGREVPKAITYLGKILPLAVMTTLIAYCLRNTTFTYLAGFAPQLIAVAITAALHLWKRNTMISVFGGTIIYMVLVQVVFV